MSHTKQCKRCGGMFEYLTPLSGSKCGSCCGISVRDKENRALRSQVKQLQSAAGFCEKHQPIGGSRNCLVCGCEKLSAAISRIDYFVGESNEMEVSIFDVYHDELAVVQRVREKVNQLETTQRELAEARAEVERLAGDLASAERREQDQIALRKVNLEQLAEARAERDEAVARLSEQIELLRSVVGATKDQVPIFKVQDIVDERNRLRAQNERLRQRVESENELARELNLQGIATALDIPLGVSIPREVLPRIKALKRKIEDLEAMRYPKP